MSSVGSSEDHNYSAIGCFLGSPLGECLRTVLLAICFTITFIVCLVQAARIIRNTRRYLSYQLIVLYIAIFECVLGMLHWYLFNQTTFIFLIIYCKDMELVVVTYFFIQSILLQFG